MFKSVEARIERARDSVANVDDVDIVFTVPEKGRYYLNTSTELGNNEGSAVRHALYLHLSCSLLITDCHRAHPERVRRRRDFRGQSCLWDEN
jgi:hypothetical protein